MTGEREKGQTKKTDYVYISGTVENDVYSCGNPCVLLIRVNGWLREEALGTNSHTWKLQQHYLEVKNPGGVSWTPLTEYWCGVNVSGGNDYECLESTGAAPSGVVMSENTDVYKPWGSTNGITVFPMVQASVVFNTGNTDTTKYRGWDTLSRANSTKLAATTGTG